MEVKGTAVVVMPAFIKKTFQEEGFKQWLQSLSPEAYEIFSKPLLSNLWYDFQKCLVGPTLKICDLFYGGEFRGAYEMGRFSADFALKGIYRLFVKMGSPEFILSKGTAILPTYYRPSSIEIPIKEKGRSIIRITEFKELHEVVEQRIAGWISRALEVSGAKNVRVAITSSLLKKQPSTDFTSTWD